MGRMGRIWWGGEKWRGVRWIGKDGVGWGGVGNRTCRATAYRRSGWSSLQRCAGA